MRRWIGRWVCRFCHIDETRRFFTKTAARAWAARCADAHLIGGVHVTTSKVVL